MRTEINKKPGRPSERSEEARAKGAKRGNNRWGVGGGGEGAVSPPPPMGYRGRGPRKIGIFEVCNYQKRNFLAGNAGYSKFLPLPHNFNFIA